MPSAEIKAGTNFGLIKCYRDVWATTRNGLAANLILDYQGYIVAGILQTVFTEQFDIWRGFLQFDMSSIPAGSVIPAASLKVYNVQRLGSVVMDVVITEGHQTEPLDVGDFDSALPYTQRDDVTVRGSRVLGDFVPNGAYFEIDFNADGISMLESACGGTLFLCLRLRPDVEDDPASVPEVFTNIAFGKSTVEGQESYLLIPAYYSASFPQDPMTRITNLIHRYNRVERLYMLEANLGEVTSDFGLPEWLTEPIPVAQEEKVTPAVGPPLVGYSPEPFPDVQDVKPPGPRTLWERLDPSRRREIQPESETRWNWWQALTPWKEEKGETVISALLDVGRTLRERFFGK